MGVGKIGSKTKAGPRISKLKSGVFFNITSKYMFVLTDIHTHDLVYFSKYHRLFFSWMVLDKMGSKPDFDNFMFQSCIAVIN